MPRKMLMSSFAGYKEYYEVDQHDPGKAVIHSLEDCEPIVERARMLSELEPGKNFRHVAVIPQHVLARAMREGWVHDKKKWKLWANDPDNKAFRTWPGHL